MFMSTEGYLDGFHEANIDHVLSFDLPREVFDHSALLIIGEH
jgi:hypothetical protein